MHYGHVIIRKDEILSFLYSNFASGLVLHKNCIVPFDDLLVGDWFLANKAYLLRYLFSRASANWHKRQAQCIATNTQML